MNLVNKIGLTTLGILTLILIYFVIRPIFKSRDDLTEAYGIVINQQYVQTYGAKNSTNAYVITLSSSYTQFAIQDTKNRAFKYLSTHSVIGMNASILYDANGRNAQSNVTYHVYEVAINGNKIWTLSEGRTRDLWILLFILLLVAFIIGAHLLAQRRKRNQVSNIS